MGVVLAGPFAQVVGECGAVERIGAAVAGGLCDGRADLVEGAVQPAEQRAQLGALRRGQFGSVAVPAVHPGEEGEQPAAERGDGAGPFGEGERGLDGQAQGGEGGHRPVVAGDRLAAGGRGVDVALQEVAAGLGGDPVAAVQQAFGDGFGGEQAAHPVAAQDLGERRVGDGRAERSYRGCGEVGTGWCTGKGLAESHSQRLGPLGGGP